MFICVDFDGTCVMHEYPKVGAACPGAVEALRELSSIAELILFTMRSGPELAEAVLWFEENNIPLFGINTNPTQGSWTSSPKAYGNVYIDDAAVGCPLIKSESGERPYVDWKRVMALLGDV